MGLFGGQALEVGGDLGKPRITCRRDRHFPARLVELLLTKRLAKWSNSKRKFTGAEPFSLENLTRVLSMQSCLRSGSYFSGWGLVRREGKGLTV